jgi:hypothetical protein
MNRWDEIQATARDAADWVCADPADRNRMANDLIKLVGLMIQAAGKGVAMDGEGDMGQGDHTCDEPTACAGDCDQTMHDAKAHNRYLMGERMQTAAQQVVDESVSADIERYERDGLAPAWVSRRVAARDGEEPVARNVRGNCSGCGVRPGSGLTHDDGCRAVAQTWGAGTWTAQPDGKLSLVPPQKPVTGLPCGAVDADDLDACGRLLQLSPVPPAEAACRVSGPRHPDVSEGQRLSPRHGRRVVAVRPGATLGEAAAGAATAGVAGLPVHPRGRNTGL